MGCVLNKRRSELIDRNAGNINKRPQESEIDYKLEATVRNRLQTTIASSAKATESKSAHHHTIEIPGVDLHTATVQNRL